MPPQMDPPARAGNASARDTKSSGRARRLAAALVAATATIATIGGADAAPQAKPNQIRYEYVAPKDPAHQSIHDQMKQGRSLESLQELLSPLRLPYPLTLKVAGCDGVANAWYNNEVITVCYELLAAIVRNAATHDLPEGVTPADTIIGPVLDVFLHETGHAVFRMLEIPVLGREEDAADQFSAFIMLRLSKDEARRMILGTAYHRAIQMPPGETPSRDAFSDEHSMPAQRAFNVMCIAYGADKKLFADLVEKDFLPRKRSESCGYEYEDLTYAMTKLIGPHIDKEAARKFHTVWSRTISARRERLSR
jgi:hypothetical protein